MNWKESLTKGYKHMTIPRKTVLIFAAVLVLPLLVVTVIWTENQVGKAYRTFEQQARRSWHKSMRGFAAYCLRPAIR